MNFRPYRAGINGGIVKICTQSKSVNSGGTDVQGYIVHSDHATGIVTTDAAGDATVPVLMELDWNGAPDGAQPVSGTVTLYVNGDTSVTINTPG